MKKNIMPCRLVCSDALEDYRVAHDKMQEYHAQSVREQSVILWLLEHTSIYTCGRNESDEQRDLPAPCEYVGRGGNITYHGPGQQILYVMAPLAIFDNDVRRYVEFLENVLQKVCAQFGIQAHKVPNTRGVFVEGKKIGAVGVRIRQQCTMHGVSLNVLQCVRPFFDKIHPCGLMCASASLQDYKPDISMQESQTVFQSVLEGVFDITER